MPAGCTLVIMIVRLRARAMVTGKKVDDPLYRPDINSYVDAIEMDALGAWSKISADDGKGNASPEKQLFVG